MLNNSETPVANISIYRLDIYRLSTLLFADRKISEKELFGQLGNAFAEAEINRLLVLIAVISRQLLDHVANQYGDHVANQYGERGANVIGTQPLMFRKACNMIIHAKDIVIREPEYFFREDGEPSGKMVKEQPYFRGQLKITNDRKEEAIVDLEKFLEICIMVSNKVTE